MQSPDLGLKFFDGLAVLVFVGDMLSLHCFPHVQMFFFPAQHAILPASACNYRVSQNSPSFFTDQFVQKKAITDSRKHDVIYKTGSMWHITMPPEEDPATATCNMYKRLRRFSCAVPEIRTWTVVMGDSGKKKTIRFDSVTQTSRFDSIRFDSRTQNPRPLKES